MSTQEFLFHNAGGNTYVRKTFGLETLASGVAEASDGIAHITATTAVTFPSAPSRKDLEHHVQHAIILLRHLIPSVAYKSFILPTSDERNDFAFRYTVPTSLDEVYSWAKDVTFFDDKIESLYAKHSQIKEDRWWRSSDDHYNFELHISPLEKGWQFSLTTSHGSVDARGVLIVLNDFFTFLATAMEGHAQPVSELKWGEEVERLTPPGPFIMTLTKTGVPPEFPDPASLAALLAGSKKMGDDSKSVSALTVKPWYISPADLGNTKEDVSHNVKFSSIMTAKMHATAKKNNRTITQVVTALQTIAHAEALLRIASQVNEERYNEILDGFSEATHYLIPMNLVDQRNGLLPEEYRTSSSSKSTPLLCADAVEIDVPMSHIRKMLRVDKATKIVHREVDMVSFWDGLVAAIADAWGNADRSAESYFLRQYGMHLYGSAKPFKMIDTTFPSISSIGDLGRLGIFEYYRPGKHNKSLTIEDLVFSIRSRTHILSSYFYQYDDQLSCHFCTGGKSMTYEFMKLFTDVFEEWTAAILQKVD